MRVIGFVAAAACGDIKMPDVPDGAAPPVDGPVVPDIDAPPPDIDAPDAPPPGECEPGAQRCSGNTPQVCDASGMWAGDVACAQQTCIAGTCQGECAPGARQCTTSTTASCDATGQWATMPLSEPRWTRTVGGATDESMARRTGMAVAADGTIWVVGGKGTSSESDFHVAHLAADGTMLWERSFGTNNEAASTVMAVAGGGAIACGTVPRGSMGCAANRLCQACVRLDDAGNTLWQRTWGGAANDFHVGNVILPHDSNSFMIMGATTDTDAWMDMSSTVIGLDGVAAGPVRSWNRDGEDQAFDVRRAADGTFVAAGYTGGWRACQQPWLVRYNSTGALMSSYLAGPCAAEAPGVYNEQRGFGFAVLPLADGSVIMAGRQWDGANRFQGYLAKVSPTSAPVQQWRRLIGGAGDESFHAIEQLPDGGFLLAGSTTTASAGAEDAFVVRTDASGMVLWSRTYGGLAADDAQAIGRAADGSYVIAGTTASTGAGGKDYYLFDIPAVCTP